jgi:cyclohexanone monooxygenase
VTDFFTLLPATPPLDHDGVYQLARHGCLDIHQVEWVRTYLASDGARLLCWFQARDAESVRLVLRHQGWHTATVCPVEAPGASRDGTADAVGEQTVVEFVDESLGQEDLVSTTDAAIAALHGAGFVVSRSLVSINGTHLVLVVDGADVTAVKNCLEDADFVPVAVWAATELSPVPSQLFDLPQQTTADRPRKVDASQPEDSVDFDAVIIGAGVSGICAAQRLVAMGLRTRLYESASDVGGVWHWNRYPGARVDSETYTYAFSFDEELIEEWDWQELFSAQPEIQSGKGFVEEEYLRVEG